MNDEVDMRKFGRLRVAMPITYLTFGLGYLAIIGVPPFSGFFSKDKIIEAAFNAGGARGWILGFAALLGAAITAFYMTRVMVMTFFGRKRWADDAHPHESPKLMTVPIIILSVGSIAAGALFAFGSSLQHWLEPVVARGFVEGEHALSPIFVSMMALVSVALGVALAYVKYVRVPVEAMAPTNVSIWTRLARRDLLQDAFNEALFMRPGQYLTRALSFFDRKVVDGAVNGTGALFGGLSVRIRRAQTGYVRTYALFILVGAALVLAAMLAARI